MPKENLYARIIEKVFLRHYKKGSTTVETCPSLFTYSNLGRTLQGKRLKLIFQLKPRDVVRIINSR